MEALILALLGASAFFVLKRPKLATPTSTGQSGQPINTNQPSGAAAGAGTAGTPSNNLGQSVAIVSGAVSTGVALGQAIDSALQGGKPSTGTTITAEAGAGAILGTTAVVALVGFAAAFPIGEIVIAVVIVVAVLAYAVASIITDIQRLQYGQAGARGDWETHWRQIYQDCFNRFRANPNASLYSDNQLDAMLIPFVDGFMEAANVVAYRQWMALPHGAGVDTHQHAIWGRDRGYYVGDADQDGGLIEDESMLHTNRIFKARPVGSTAPLDLIDPNNYDKTYVAKELALHGDYWVNVPNMGQVKASSWLAMGSATIARVPGVSSTPPSQSVSPAPTVQPVKVTSVASTTTTIKNTTSGAKLQ